MINDLNERICTRLNYDVEPLNVRTAKFGTALYRATMNGSPKNKVVLALAKTYCLIRLGHIVCRGDEFQAGLQAVTSTYLELTKDLQSSPKANWAHFFIRVLDGHLKANKVTGILMGDNLAEDVGYEKNERKANSKMIHVKGNATKVESRPVVVAELENYLATVHDITSSMVTPDKKRKKDKQEPPPRPAIRMRSLYYDM